MDAWTNPIGYGVEYPPRAKGGVIASIANGGDAANAYAATAYIERPPRRHTVCMNAM